MIHLHLGWEAFTGAAETDHASIATQINGRAWLSALPESAPEYGSEAAT
jgi:hypothetical protein